MEKFIGFAKALLTNRLGIILAALNLCLLASKNFVQYAFSHAHGAECLFFKNLFFIPPTVVSGPDNSIYAVNIPALIIAQIPAYFTKLFTSDLCFFSDLRINIIFLAAAIVLQWLFIGWSAKMIARKIKTRAEARL